MKVKFGIFIIILFATFVVDVNSVEACSIAQPQFIIELPLNEVNSQEDQKCLDAECAFSLEKNKDNGFVIVQTASEKNSSIREVASIYEGKLYVHNLLEEDFEILLSDEFFEAVDILVTSDLKPIKGPFQENIRSWIEDDRGYLLQGDTTLRLYDANIATELLTEAEQKLGQCSYSEVEAYNGEWMFVTEKTRSYCQSSDGDGASCPGITINHQDFIRYNLNNLTVIGIPYLMKYLVGAGAVVWGIFLFVRWIIKRNHKEEK